MTQNKCKHLEFWVLVFVVNKQVEERLPNRLVENRLIPMLRH